MRLGLPSALFLAIVLLLAAVLVRTTVVPLIMALAIAIGISPHGQPPRILGLTRNLAAPVGLLLFIGVFVGASFIVGIGRP
jgi:predicted PurR-regulated permease PerM